MTVAEVENNEASLFNEIVVDETEKKTSPPSNQVLTLRNRLVRLLNNENEQSKQGALEYNAYLMNNILSETCDITPE